MTKLRVVMATSGDAPRLETALASMAKCTRPAELHEIMVIENGTQCMSRHRVEAFQPQLPVRYHFIHQPGKCRALNHAIASCDDSDLLLMTDDDVTYDSNWLNAYAECLRQPTGKFYGGSTTSEFETRPEQWLLRFLPPSATGMTPSNRSLTDGQTVFMGFNWAAWAGDLRRAGRFDELIGPGSPICGVGDETDMQQRLAKIGLSPVALPDAEVRHYVPAEKCSAEWIVRRARQIGRAHGYLAARNDDQAIANSFQSPLRLWNIQMKRWITHLNPPRQLHLRCKQQRILGYREGWTAAREHITSHQRVA